MTQIGLEALKLGETKRSNLVQEAETERANRAREGENLRTNLANENIKKGNLDELIRSNKANESIKWSTLNETKRANLANEGIKQNTFEETRRSNMANEWIKQGTLNETERANKEKEAQNRFEYAMDSTSQPYRTEWSQQVLDPDLGYNSDMQERKGMDTNAVDRAIGTAWSTFTDIFSVRLR